MKLICITGMDGAGKTTLARNMAAALLQQHPRPSDAEIAAQLSRHICSCGTHPRILRAVRSASRLLRSSG